MNKIEIKTLATISEEETKLLKEYFHEDSFTIGKTIDESNLVGSELIIGFVLSSIGGGILYDLVKEGTLKIIRYFKSNPVKRQVIITIEHKDLLAQIKENEIRVFENGKKLNCDSIEELFEIIEKDHV